METANTEIDYIDRLPKNPPEDIINWVLREGAFKNTEYIIFKQGRYTDPETGRSKSAASCICTSCGQAFFAQWVSTDCTHCHAYGIQLEGESYQDMAEMKCPHCEEAVTLRHVSSLRYGISKECYVVVPSTYGSDFILTSYIIIKRIDAQGVAHFYCNEYDAFLFTQGKNVRFTKHTRFMNSISWLTEWKQLKTFRDSCAYPDYFYPGAHERGTCIEHARLTQYREAAGDDFLPVTYLRLYAKRPQVENLITLGVGGFLAGAIAQEQDTGYSRGVTTGNAPILKGINWKEKSPYKMLRLNRNQFKAFLQHKDAPYVDKKKLLTLIQAGLDTKADCAALSQWVKSHSVEELVCTGENITKILSYLHRQKADFVFLRDYWTAARKLQLGMEDAAVKWPKNLMRAHDRAQELVTVETSKEERLAFAQLYKRLSPLSYANEFFSIVPAKSTKELIAEGKALGHCVGGYAKAHCALKSVFFIRRAKDKGKPFFTLQLDIQTKKVLQNLGENNKQPPKEVLDFVTEWMSNAVARFEIPEKKRPKKKVASDKNHVLQLTA